MKCPNCSSEMRRINGGNDVFYFQCEKCGNSLGKPKPQSIEEILDDITKEQAE